MLTSKQIAYLKALANTRRSVLQIGYQNLTPEIINEIMNYVNKNELIKMNVLDTATMDIYDVANKLNEIGLETVQIVGSVLIMYKHNSKAKNHILLP